MKKIYILGGGTFNHVRNHLSLATPAFGETAKSLKTKFDSSIVSAGLSNDFETHLILTKMADSSSGIVTNQDVSLLIDKLISDPDTRGIIFNIALADFEGSIGDVQSGKYADRLQTKNGTMAMELTPSEKLIGKIRKQRKDIFVVGFKTTANQTNDIQYTRGLELLKKNSLNLVLANDTVTRNNIIIAPEETRYGETTNRDDVLNTLVTMTLSRIQNTFTRSTVIPGDSIPWNGDLVPSNLRQVVDHCIQAGAYKPFLGKTAGHFATKVNNTSILTSIRKTNFNNLDEVGLVQIDSKNQNEVVAHGFKPSVGGQSQRIIFSEHPELDCIVHFHCPPTDHYTSNMLPVAQQWPNECGSHQCGKNTSDHLRSVDLGDGDSLKVVFLDSHGPNIVFDKTTNPEKIISFINQNFDLSAKTGGLVAQTH